MEFIVWLKRKKNRVSLHDGLLFMPLINPLSRKDLLYDPLDYSSSQKINKVAIITTTCMKKSTQHSIALLLVQAATK
jgi:hypothetical protein